MYKKNYTAPRMEKLGTASEMTKFKKSFSFYRDRGPQKSYGGGFKDCMS